VSDLALAYQLAGTDSGDADAAEEGGWVARARGGDLEAFDAIMARYEGRLLRFLTGLVSDVEVARELCQDTVLAAYQALPRMHGELRLSSWLHTIALNRARSYHRRRRLRILVPLESDDRLSSGPDLQEAAVSRDTVQRVLARLPSQYAQPLLLQTASGLSCREIAEILRCSEGAVKVRLLRARQAFRRLYEEEVRCTG
jgi:RNA polymerase sigma factor (sigma-70 family)